MVVPAEIFNHKTVFYSVVWEAYEITKVVSNCFVEKLCLTSSEFLHSSNTGNKHHVR